MDCSPFWLLASWLLASFIRMIIDFQRFRRSREFMAYLGLVPREYSSGDTQHRGALTKAGNVSAVIQ